MRKRQNEFSNKSPRQSKVTELKERLPFLKKSSPRQQLSGEETARYLNHDIDLETP